MLCLFKFSHPNRCVVVPHYSFNLHFFNEKSCCVLLHLLICHNSIPVWVYSNLLPTFLKKWVVLFLLSFGRFLYILDISSSSYAWFKIFSLYHNTITITIIMVIDYYVNCSFLLVSCTWDSLILLICGFIDFIKFGIFSVFTFSNIFSSPYPLSLSTLITSILDTWNCSISHWFSIHLKKILLYFCVSS